MSHASNYVMFFRAILDTDLVDDQNSLALIVLSALRAWRGHGKMTNGIYPGESFLKRPARMSDKEYRAAKTRLTRNGLLSFRTVRNHTICRLTENCEKLIDPKILWGEVRGESSSAENPARASHPSHRTFLRGEPRGEVSGSGANLLADKGEVRGEPRGDLPLVGKSRPATTCEADQDSRGELRGEVEGEVPAQKGRTLNKKEDKNKDGSSRGDLLESLWAEVVPVGEAERPPKPRFQRNCTEWLSKFPEETVWALIVYANANVRSKNGYIWYIDATIKGKTGIQDARDYGRAEMDRRRKAVVPSGPPKSSDSIARNLALTSLRAELFLAQKQGDQAGIERIEAAIENTLAQSGQPTPCGHGPLSGAGQGLRPSEPGEDEDKEPKA